MQVINILSQKRAVPLLVSGAAALLAAGLWLDIHETSVQDTPATADALVISPEIATVDGEAKEVSFRIRNLGDVPVFIKGVFAHCGCTVAALPEPRTVPPGGESIMRVRAVPPNTGEKTTQIDIYSTDDSERPLVATLLLRGRPPSAPMIQYQPNEVIVRGPIGSVLTSEFTVVTVEDREANRWIEGVESDSLDASAELLGTEDLRGVSEQTVRREYCFRVNAKGASRGRKRVANVNFRLTAAPNGLAPSSISVMSDCWLAVEAIPDVIFASLSEKDLPRRFRIRFRSPSVGRSLALSPTATPSWLQVDQFVGAEQGSLFAGEMRVCIVDVPRSHDGGPLRTTLILATNAPECPKVEIPVVVSRRP